MAFRVLFLQELHHFFDLDRKEILFYTNDTIINLNIKNEGKISKVIIYFIITLLLIFTCVNAHIKKTQLMIYI